MKSADYFCNKCIRDDTKAAACRSPNCIRKKTKYGKERFSIWWMEFFHPARWRVTLGSWHWIRQVAAPCNVAHGSGMICHWIRPNVRHIAFLLPVSISPLSPQSTLSFYEVLSKSDRPRQINNVCRFSRRRIAAILDFKGHNGFFEKPMYDILYNTIVLYRMSQVHNNNTTAA